MDYRRIEFLQYSKRIFITILFLANHFSYAEVCGVVSSFTSMFTAKNRVKVLSSGIYNAFSDSNYNIKNNIFLAENSTQNLSIKIDEAIKKGCKVFVGLYTSRECLLALKKISDKDIVIFSPTCAHQKITNFPGHIYTGVSSLEHYANATKRLGGVNNKNTLFVVNKAGAYSLNYFENFNKNKNRNIKILEVSKDGKILGDQKIIQKYISNSKNFVFTTYPKTSIPALRYINKWGDKDIKVFGTPAWIYDKSLFSTLSFIKEKKINPLVVRKPILNNRGSEDLTAGLKNIYNEGYNMTSLSVYCYSNRDINLSVVESMKKCVSDLSKFKLKKYFKYKSLSPFNITHLVLTPLFEVR
tara:strand:- start:1031 stop:2098 length:1068 start_codon:yes stop_codon:yes gene_type:complete